MCGIFGIYAINNFVSLEPIIGECFDSIANRGPDGRGFWSNATTQLGHTRLSILDLSVEANCPFIDSETGSVLVFNGEIYNFRELRAELISREISFKTSGDTEVVLRGCLEWGVELFLSKARGMFAFALWDSCFERLIIARDIFGEKPLYYINNTEHFAFSSSINTLKLIGNAEIELPALNQYLADSYISGSQTIYTEIKSFPPASYCIINANGVMNIKRYWQLGEFSKGATCQEDVLEDLLRKSVQRCLVSDVPVGIALSGGLDSSLIAAFAKENVKDLQSYSVAFDDTSIDESDHAESVARHLGLIHTKIKFCISDVFNNLPFIIHECGQPFADDSVIATYVLAEKSRNNVKVLLTGDGGDELFCGYWSAKSAMIADSYRSAIRTNSMAHVAVQALMNSLASRALPSIYTRWLALEKIAHDDSQQYLNSSSWQSMLGNIVSSNERQKPCVTKDVEDSSSILQLASIRDIEKQLAYAFLPKTDSATMAASLEARAPFLDRDLAEYAWRMPLSAKLSLFENKISLRKIARKYLPREICNRKKHGFTLPVSTWFRSDLGLCLKNMLADSNMGQISKVDIGFVENALNEHMQGVRDHSQRLWQILCLEIWCRTNVSLSMDKQSSLYKFL